MRDNIYSETLHQEAYLHSRPPMYRSLTRWLNLLMDIHKEPISSTELLQIMDTHKMDDILDEGNNEKKKKRRLYIYSCFFLKMSLREGAWLCAIH